MPVFEYRCNDCRKRFSLLFGVVEEKQSEKCPLCGSADVSRMISRFASLRSEDELMDAATDPSKIGDMDDPAQIQSWMRQMGREMGEDLDDDFDEILDETDSEPALQGL